MSDEGERAGGGKAGQQAEDLDSARLVTRFQAGDRDQAFTALYQRYFERVFAYLKIAFNNTHDAEDYTQQVFLKVLEALPRYEPRRGKLFRAWLFVIVRHVALRGLELQSRVEVTDPAELNRRHDELGEEDLRILKWISDTDLLAFLERLPLPQRQVVLLRYMLDLNGVQIARVLGRSHEDVRILQHRALHHLKKRLTSLGREPPPEDPAQMSRWRKQDTVLRARRWAL